MARKIKYSPKLNQPGLFDLDEQPSVGKPEVGSHPIVEPEIQDFVVNVPDNATEEKSLRDNASGLVVDEVSVNVPDTLLFISFGSGSSGNCAYIGTREEGVLIDAGVDPKVVSEKLHNNGLSMSCVKGICLTHDHGDHVRYVYAFVRKNSHIGIFCTPRTLNGMLRRHSISRRIKDYHRPIYKEFPFTAGGLNITAFEVSHDGTDNAGFFLTRGNHRFAVATDLGCITPRVEYYMRQAQYIMIESNYDAEMLRTGKYAMYLKARIVADSGHLDNVVTGKFLAQIMSPQITHVFLCHLSQDNNTPELAVDVVRQALIESGCNDIGDGSAPVAPDGQLQLMPLPRFDASTLYVLRARI